MEFWPSGVWFGLTRKRAKICCIVLSLFVLACASVYLIALGFARHRATQAREMLDRIKMLKPGESTLEEVRQIAKEYEKIPSPIDYPCSPASCYSAVWVHYSWAEDKFGDHDLVNALGLRSWKVEATISVRDNKVQFVRADVAVHAADHEWIGGRWENTVMHSDSDWQLLQSWFEKESYFVVSYNLYPGGENGLGIQANLTLDASSVDKTAGFDIDLSCLTRLGGCRGYCDLMPQNGRYFNYLYDRAVANSPLSTGDISKRKRAKPN